MQYLTSGQLKRRLKVYQRCPVSGQTGNKSKGWVHWWRMSMICHTVIITWFIVTAYYCHQIDELKWLICHIMVFITWTGKFSCTLATNSSLSFSKKTTRKYWYFLFADAVIFVWVIKCPFLEKVTFATLICINKIRKSNEKKSNICYINLYAQAPTPGCSSTPPTFFGQAETNWTFIIMPCTL